MEKIEPSNIRQYHPDSEINAEIIKQALDAEILDLKIGYSPRWWVCPKCEASHQRGHFGIIGNHRCMRCGYTGTDGTMHINDPRPIAKQALEESKQP